MPSLFHVVLYRPEIPNNTGNIGRTCVATGCSLHLIHPLGFETSAKACRRAGLDYWPRLDVHHHESFDQFAAGKDASRLWYFSTKARRTVFDARLARGDFLVFGPETAGLPDDLLTRAGDRVLGFPMLAGERSLNLATVVCSAIYEGVRQLLASGQVAVRNGGQLEIGDVPTC